MSLQSCIATSLNSVILAKLCFPKKQLNEEFNVKALLLLNIIS